MSSQIRWYGSVEVTVEMVVVAVELVTVVVTVVVGEKYNKGWWRWMGEEV